MLRNAIVRSTLTYGIQTLDLTEQGKQRMDGFAFYCLRQIQDIYWSQKPQKPQSKSLYIQMQQPTTASWVKKLRLKHAFAQTRSNWNIHSHQLPMITKTRQTWHEEWQEQKTKLTLLQQQGQQCVNTKEWTTKAKAIMGDQPHGVEKGLIMIKKLIKFRDKYPPEPQMQEIEPQDYDTWANMMLRYTKDKDTQEHIARIPTQEHECKTCGKPFLSRTGLKVHQRLKAQCAQAAKTEDMNNKACPNKDCNYKHHDTRQMQAHLFYHCHKQNILHGLNCLTTNTRKNRNKMINIGVPKENMTCLQNNMNYNTGTQTWTCNICNKTEQPQDVQNMTRHIIRHKRRQQKTEQEHTKKDTIQPISHIQRLRIQALLLSPTKTADQETPMPELTTELLPHHPESQSKNDRQDHQTIWETLEYVQWREIKKVWQCMEQGRKKKIKRKKT